MHPLRGPKIDGYNKWQFTDDDLILFTTRVEGLIRSSSARSPNDFIRSGLALDIFRRAGGNCGTLFQAVFDRKISLVGGQQKPWLSNLRFCVDEVRTFVREQATRIHGEFYSVAEAAGFIGTNPPAVYFLLKKGLIQASELPNLSGSRFWIKRRDLDRFRRNYFILTRERARTLGTKTDHIAKLLERQGVKSVSGRGLDNGPQTVFKAADIAAIDLQRMISKSRPRGFPRPLLTRTVELSRVSEILGVDRSSVLTMIDNGFLTPSTPRRHKPEEEQFHIHIRLVEYCKRKNLPYLSLISSSIATNILRVGPHQLRLLVKWGTLKAIYAKPPRYAYFIRDDVEALVKSDDFQLALTKKSHQICLNRTILQRC